MKLDFSQIHPLDHRIGSRYCREVTNFPEAPKGWGNIPRHFKLWRDYKMPETLPFRLYHKILCLAGHHKYVTAHIARPEMIATAKTEGWDRHPRPDEMPEFWEERTYCHWCLRDEDDG